MFMIIVDYWADENPYRRDFIGPFELLADAEEFQKPFPGLYDTRSGTAGECAEIYLFTTEGKYPLSYLE